MLQSSKLVPHFILVSGYDKIINNKTETCHDRDRISTRYAYDTIKCKTLCDSEIDCGFFYINDDTWCVTYKSCNQRRTPPFSGSTFKNIAGNIQS